MPRIPLALTWTAGMLAASVLLTTCDNFLPSPVVDERTGAPGEALRGTWLREYTEDGVEVRRLLVLAPDGAFHEKGKVTTRAGAVTQTEHEGNWIYDGTNLKRKYTLMNGKSPSRLNLPFATFEIRFESRNEFTGVDHIHGHRIRYRRVAPETQL
jgi:hypothetical protein